MMVIIDCLVKIVNHKLIMTIIDRTKLEEIIINILIRSYSLLKLILNDKNFLMSSKF